MDTPKNIMIALLPTTTTWCKIPLPHLTLVFAGNIEDHSPTDFNVMAKDACSIAMVTRPIILTTTGVEKLGPPDDLVSALMFRSTTELLALRNFVKQWDRSDFPEFRPHATIGPYPSIPDIVPGQVGFNRIMVAWGDQQITWWLNHN